MKMNAKNIIAALAVVAAAGPAFANDVAGQVVGGSEFVAPDAGFVSTRTREQIAAELQQAEAEGSYAQAQKEFVAPDTGFAAAKTREQVVAELKQAQADGSYAQLQQEYDGQFPATTASASRLARNGKAVNLN
jgi:hypothetical protein